jgi:hypothetical protein
MQNRNDPFSLTMNAREQLDGLLDALGLDDMQLLVGVAGRMVSAAAGKPAPESLLAVEREFLAEVAVVNEAPRNPPVVAKQETCMQDIDEAIPDTLRMLAPLDAARVPKPDGLVDPELFMVIRADS